MTRERTRERRERKDPGHSARGLSTIQHLENALALHTGRYLEMQAIPFGDHDSKPLGVERGIIRGLAMALARMRFPYENQTTATKRIEKEAVRTFRQAEKEGS
jgi:hypothetical protein